MTNELGGFTAFVQLQKVDVAKREVWGVAAVEQPDGAREIMDYEKSLPNFLNWSRDMYKASGGKSQGNLRAMHRDVAAGKLIHFEPRDATKDFYIGTKIVDDNEWKKVLEGVYTGFSVGGSYGAKWEDAVMKGYTRYEAKPVEISLVDKPCMPGATFQVIKADGQIEMRKLATSDAGDLTKGDYEGHPFRGNQYEDAEGGGVGGSVKIKRGQYAGTRGKIVERYGSTVVVSLEGREGDTRKFSEDELDQDGDGGKPATKKRSPSRVKDGDTIFHDGESVKIAEVSHEDGTAVFKTEDGQELRFDDEDSVQVVEFPDRVTEAAGTEAEFKDRKAKQAEARAAERQRREEALQETRAKAREKFVNSTPPEKSKSKFPDRVAAAMDMTEEEFNTLDEMGYVKPWGVSKEGMSELESMRAERKKAGRILRIKPEGNDLTFGAGSSLHAWDIVTEAGIESDQSKGKLSFKNEADRDKALRVLEEFSNKYGTFHSQTPPDLDVRPNKKFLPLTTLVKGAGMKPEELLKRLAASNDPAMEILAEELSKAFPPAKKDKNEESETDDASESAESGDKKQDPKAKEKAKKNPFSSDDDQADPNAEDSAEGEDGDPEAEGMTEEGAEGAEAVEQPAEATPEQTEAIRAVVIQLLEELGFVQEQGGEMGAPKAVKFITAGDLQKRLKDREDALEKAYGAISVRQRELTEDLAKVADVVNTMAKNGGPAPVVRDLGTLTAGAAAEMQQESLIKTIIDGTNDPVVKQALQAELTTLAIKKVQRSTTSN